MARFDLTDFEWSVVQPLLPNKPHGVPQRDPPRGSAQESQASGYVGFRVRVQIGLRRRSGTQLFPPR